MWNAGVDELQAGIKISGRYINSLRYADDTTLITESEEELEIHSMKVKEESEKSRLKNSTFKTNKQTNKNKIIASDPIQFSSVQALSHVRLFVTP